MTIEEGENFIAITLEANATAKELEELESELGYEQNFVVIIHNFSTFPEEVIEQLNHWKKRVKPKKSFKFCGRIEHLKAIFDSEDCAPTLTEARDLVFMEEVERDLNGL